MKTLKSLVTIALLYALVCSMGFADEEIKLDKVPKVVMQKVAEISKSKLKGFKPKTAEKDKAWGKVVYRIEGTVKDKLWEIEVKLNKKGKIVDVEIEEED